MVNPTVQLRGDTTGTKRLFLWCPGCEALHAPTVSRDREGGVVWEWNGSLDNVTISPSLLVNMGVDGRVCHSFVQNHQWQFLGDCWHDLKNQTVPLVPLPDWLVKDE